MWDTNSTVNISSFLSPPPMFSFGLSIMFYYVRRQLCLLQVIEILIREESIFRDSGSISY
ncbi:hypothetical protein BDW75DRAFT_197010 [Aspergillus navahoensis]